MSRTLLVELVVVVAVPPDIPVRRNAVNDAVTAYSPWIRTPDVSVLITLPLPR
jgi:hypothetical protein